MSVVFYIVIFIILFCLIGIKYNLKREHYFDSGYYDNTYDGQQITFENPRHLGYYRTDSLWNNQDPIYGQPPYKDLLSKSAEKKYTLQRYGREEQREQLEETVKEEDSEQLITTEDETDEEVEVEEELYHDREEDINYTEDEDINDEEEDQEAETNIYGEDGGEDEEEDDVRLSQAELSNICYNRLMEGRPVVPLPRYRGYSVLLFPHDARRVCSNIKNLDKRIKCVLDNGTRLNNSRRTYNHCLTIGT